MKPVFDVFVFFISIGFAVVAGFIIGVLCEKINNKNTKDKG